MRERDEQGEAQAYRTGPTGTAMQIHTLLVSVNQLDSLTDGAVVVLERDVGLLDQGDALVVRLVDGTEQLLVIVEALFEAWVATCNMSGRVERLRLEYQDARRLRVAFESEPMPVAGKV